jgi:glycosyltransferase involved in cell wall biosynthesis
MLLFAEELHALGHRVDLILVKAEGAYQNLLPAGVRVFDLGCRRTICALPAVVRYLRLEHPQAIYSTIPHANLLTLIAAKISRQSTKVIVRESNVPITALSLSVVSKIVSKLSPLAYTWADAIIAVSEGVAHELTSLNPKLGPKIKVLPTPVVSSRLDELAGELPAHAWLGDSRVPFILAAGRLHPQKDFATLLRAFTRVRSTTDVRLIILGEGKERRFLESLAEELGITDSISMPGFVENPFPYLKQARTFVLSSRYEGMPNVLIQAMAFGTPVVATDCPGGAAEILRRGDWGVVVPVGDCLALSQAILSSLQSPRRLDAAKFVHENYSVSRSTLEYLKVSGA